ncbi:MFS transporter [Novosphingobium sp. G106]|uniref:MFS transporter n=1 Tax=Novosphingobium sp. G106 TaxID=2849500 RepID=UPI001C2D9522|nr:MFS transporter [Novosphingobium sp. G106]MBV1686672.1 MFS transporter [Novosphingobium sp. G106]
MGTNRSFGVGWRQVFASMVVMACSGMIAPTYGIIAVHLASEFGSSRMVLMLAITVMSVAAGIISPIAGGFMDKSSLRRIMMIGVAGMVGGFFALSFVTSFAAVLVVYGLLMAASQSMAGPISGTVLLTRWFEKRRGAALGIAVSGIGAGSMIFPLVMQGLFDHFAWREGLRVLSLILACITVPALLLIVDRPSDRGLYPDGADAPPPLAKGASAPVALSAREIISDPAFWLLALVVTVILAGMMGSVTNIVPMARDLGVEANAAAFVVSVYAGMAFVAKLTFGAVADRISPRILMTAILAVFAAGMVALSMASTGYWMILLGAGLVGLGGMILPLQSFVAPRIFGPAVVGKAVGLLSLAQLVGLLVTPPVFGLIYDKTGSYSPIFVAFAVMAVGAMLVVPKIRLNLRATDIAPTASRSGGEPEPQPVP